MTQDETPKPAQVCVCLSYIEILDTFPFVSFLLWLVVRTYMWNSFRQGERMRGGIVVDVAQIAVLFSMSSGSILIIPVLGVGKIMIILQISLLELIKLQLVLLIIVLVKLLPLKKNVIVFLLKILHILHWVLMLLWDRYKCPFI